MNNGIAAEIGPQAIIVGVAAFVSLIGFAFALLGTPREQLLAPPRRQRLSPDNAAVRS